MKIKSQLKDAQFEIKSGGPSAIKGAVALDSADNQLKYRDYAGTEREVMNTDEAQTVTNKSVDADNNTITNIANDEIKAAAGIVYSKLSIADGDLTIAKTNGLQTALDAKVDETNPTLNGSVSGTGVLDEDDMVSDSNTKLATQQSIKAYVDSSVLGKFNSSDVVDEDNMTSNSDTKVPTQQSVKAYVDNEITGAAAAVPTGSVQAYVGSTAPSGWLLCDGSAISRTTYSSLYSVVADSFGEGDGSTTFNLPDLRGRFIRGWDNSSGNDPDAASRTAMDGNSGASTGDSIGSYQADAMQGHWHEQYTDSTAAAASGGGRLTMGANTSASANNRMTSNNWTRNPISDGSNGTPRTTSETRPVNISMNYIIKT